MRVIDRLTSFNLFGNNKELEDILSFVYQHGIYISDLLDEEVTADVLKFTNTFLNVVDKDHYDGEESASWERFLMTEIKDLEL